MDESESEFKIDSYEEWITHVFDHDDPDWHRDIHSPCWNAENEPAAAVAYMTRLFEQPEELIGRFTLEQIGAGIDFVINSSKSECAFALLDKRVPIKDRVRCIRAISTLYEKLFAYHIPDEKRSNHRKFPNCESVCFMFWDLFPMYSRTTSMFSRWSKDVKENRDDYLKIEEACMDVLEATLNIDHIACQEGALHGLGHWQVHDPPRVKRVVDEFLKTIDRNHPLYKYARHARKGSVQ